MNATTVARRLAAFEDDLAAQLFSRTRDGLVPTAAAEEMVAAAELVERQSARIVQAVGGGDARLAGRVRLTAVENISLHFLVDLLGDFHEQHPDIQLELNTSDAMADLSRGEADVAIRHRSPDTGPGVATSGHVDIIAKRVGSMGVAIYASKEYLDRSGCPRDADDVEGHEAILPREDAMYLPGSTWARSVTSRVQVTLRSDSLSSMQLACRAGMGLCALPCFTTHRYADLMRVSDLVDRRDTWLLMPADLRRVARVRAFWGFLLDAFERCEPIFSGEETPPGRDMRVTATSEPIRNELDDVARRVADEST